jgi:hypothetical protein
MKRSAMSLSSTTRMCSSTPVGAAAGAASGRAAGAAGGGSLLAAGDGALGAVGTAGQAGAGAAARGATMTSWSSALTTAIRLIGRGSWLAASGRGAAPMARAAPSLPAAATLAQALASSASTTTKSLPDNSAQDSKAGLRRDERRKNDSKVARSNFENPRIATRMVLALPLSDPPCVASGHGRTTDTDQIGAGLF